MIHRCCALRGTQQSQFARRKDVQAIQSCARRRTAAVSNLIRNIITFASESLWKGFVNHHSPKKSVNLRRS